MPHEASVRAWLARAGLAREDIEDVIQDSYCSFAGLEQVDHIERPASYFFQTARNFVTRRAARRKIVPFVPLADQDYRDEQPGPERDVGGRLALVRAMALLETLPERRRMIFKLRRIEGLSQREIAKRVSVSENIVEHEIKIGLAQLKQAWEAANAAEAESLAHVQKGRRA